MPRTQRPRTRVKQSAKRYISSALSPHTGMQPLPMALPGNTWAGEGDPGCVRTALSRT